MPNWIWMLLVQVALIALNAVFAGSEIAILSVNEFKLNKLAEEGNKKAIRLKKMTKDPSQFLSTIQIAITLSGFLGSAFAADNFSGAMADWMLSLGIPLPYSTLDTISVILITIILSYFTLVFGELVPKQVAIHKSEQMALSVSGLIKNISVVFMPLVKLLTLSTNGVLRLMGINPDQEEEAVSEEEIIMMVNAGEENGTIESDEKQLISNVFAFNDLEAKDIMTHRTNMVSLDLEDPDSWHQIIYDTTRTLIPVYEENTDHIIGILDTKKYFRLPQSLKGRERIMAALNKPFFVWESIKADDLFGRMKKQREKLAIVLDEYGGVSGLISQNDLVEELVGEFDQDEETDEIALLPDGSYLVRGSASVNDLSKVLHEDIDADYGSLNGLVYHLIQGVPEDGVQADIPFEKWMISPKEVKAHRVKQAIIRKNPDLAKSSSPESDKPGSEQDK